MGAEMTRRTFVRAAAAGAAVGALRAAPALRIGIGAYSYHTLSMDAMIVQLAALRIGEIEMSRGEFMLMHNPTAEMFQSARAKLDAAGIRCVSYYPATISTTRELDDTVRFTKLLGASNVSGDATGEMLRRIDARFTREGLTFGIHNHFFPGGKFPYKSPEDVWKALAGLSPAVGATADVGQFASCGHDPVAAIRKLSPRLKLVHLKDVEAPGGEDNVLLGRGIARIREVMRELRERGFRNLVAIEYEKESGVEADVKQEVEYARRLASR